jgi:hypothetical protein
VSDPATPENEDQIKAAIVAALARAPGGEALLRECVIEGARLGHRLGTADAIENVRAETDMVVAGIEQVAQRQINNSADAAIFAVMVSAKIPTVVVDFEAVAEQLALNRFVKTYNPNGSTCFQIIVPGRF